MAAPMLGQAQRKKKNKPQPPAPVAAPQTGVDYKAIGAALPELRLVKQDRTTLRNADLNNGATLMLMLFNPTCEHCEDQTDTLRKYIYLFKKTNLILVAGPMMGPYLDMFKNGHKLDDYPTIQLALDSNAYADKTFLYQTLPQINIYDKNQKLVKIFVGNVPIDSLRQYIE